MLSEFQFAKQTSVPAIRLVHTQTQNLWNGSQAHGSEMGGQFSHTLIKQIKDF